VFEEMEDFEINASKLVKGTYVNQGVQNMRLVVLGFKVRFILY
jgi:hypothetical protein